jgi:hypothetical protein
MVLALAEKAARPVGDGTRITSNENNQSTISTNYLFTAAVLMIVGTAGFLIVLVESVLALQGVYQWYPQFVAQQWFIYDELFTIFTFFGVLFGLLAASLMLSKRSSTGTLITGLLCTISGASVFVTCLIAPLAVLWKSILYYFLPLFLAPLVGTLLFYYVKLIR